MSSRQGKPLPDDPAERLAELVKAAVEHGPDGWPSFLDEACRLDPAMRAKVEALLSHHERARRFIEKSAVELMAATLVREKMPEVNEAIGNYEILSLIGSGGMGEVYLAEDGQLHRKVALKIVRRGLYSGNIIRRFQREEQILASLTHPNIARLYGGAVTSEGIPYFVMEYVDGARLDYYCDEQKLTIRERLQLFRRICSAVSYAHQHLVIHRDLKPANIRVAADGEPKLLDFGIAKLLEPQTSNIAEQTMTLLGVMTPEYASPEQVRAETMTTASDVYSLGVVLYELLTGQKPYQIANRSPANVERAIMEQEPPRPSMAVARSDGSSNAQVPNSKLLRGDLDNIVLKALRKEPERRYVSVAQFSEDIRRYLDGRPVIARKDTITYRTSKFVVRHKLAVAAAVLILLTIVGGSIAALREANDARRERDFAEQERLKAERINTFLQRMLSFSNQSYTSVWPVAQKKDVTVNQMLDRITPRVEAELKDQPAVRGQILRTIGSAYASQGQYEAADKALRAALQVQRALYGEDNREVADTMLELGVLAYREQNHDQASRLLEKARFVYQKRQQIHSSEYSAAKYALALDYLGAVKLLEIDAYVAKPFLTEALEVASTANLQGEERGVLAAVRSDAGAVMLYTGEVEKGETLLREALKDWHQISAFPRWEQGATLTMLGVARLNQNQLDDAEEYMREGEQVYRQTLNDQNYYLAMNLSRQACVFLARNNLKAAEEKAKDSLAMLRDFSPDNRFAWATPMLILGQVLVKAGRPGDAENYLRQAVAIYEGQASKNFSVIAQIKISLTQSLVAQDRLPEAERIAFEVHDEVARHLCPQHPALKSTAANLAKIYEEEGKSDLAAKLR